MPLTILRKCSSCEEPFRLQLIHKLILRFQYGNRYNDEETALVICTRCLWRSDALVIEVIQAIQHAPLEIFQEFPDKHVLSKFLKHILIGVGCFCQREYRMIPPWISVLAAEMLFRWRNDYDWEIVHNALLDFDKGYTALYWHRILWKEVGRHALNVWVNESANMPDSTWDVSEIAPKASDLIVRADGPEDIECIVWQLDCMRNDFNPGESTRALKVQSLLATKSPDELLLAV